MKQDLKNPVRPINNGQGEPQTDKQRKSVWKVLVFFVPMPSGGGLPKPPNNKNWVEMVLLVLKVLAAMVALWKAIGWTL